LIVGVPAGVNGQTSAPDPVPISVVVSTRTKRTPYFSGEPVAAPCRCHAISLAITTYWSQVYQIWRMTQKSLDISECNVPHWRFFKPTEMMGKNGQNPPKIQQERPEPYVTIDTPISLLR